LNTFNANENGGLVVNSKGAVTLNSITANSNLSTDGVYVNDTYSGPASPQTITLTGTNNFNDNTGKGAFLVGNGKITASNVTANWNIGAAGLDLNNQNSDSTARPLAAITLSGINTFLGNTQSGLMVEATGSISVSTVTELGSSSFTNSPGVYLDTGLLPGT